MSPKRMNEAKSVRLVGMPYDPTDVPLETTAKPALEPVKRGLQDGAEDTLHLSSSVQSKQKTFTYLHRH
jgi:hypothetical protein